MVLIQSQCTVQTKVNLFFITVSSFYNNYSLNNLFLIFKNKFIYLVTDLRQFIDKTVINYDVLDDYYAV